MNINLNILIILKNQDKITNEIQLEDFYYEIFNDHNTAYKISFNKIN